MRALYFDCFAGVSGNMILGSFIDLGIDPEKFTSELRKLDLPDFDIKLSKHNKAGISATYVEVLTNDTKKHRHLPEIENIIRGSGLSESVKQKSISVFRRLAEAEAKIHGIDVEKVHFHEVGAVDTIVDIVGACVGFEMLEVERFFCSEINVGDGFVEIAHGMFPVPAPATAELLKNAKIFSNSINTELTTPTGAAIITTFCDKFGELPPMRLMKIGYGAGKKDFKGFPNVLRIFLGDLIESENDERVEVLSLLQTNIDDVTPEILGFVMEKALEMGALDCWFTPIQMKKNRPATLVSLLCYKEIEDRLSELLFRETTTLGIRITEIKRVSLQRENLTFESRYGRIRLKKSKLAGRILNVKPEYEDLHKIAKAIDKPIKEVESDVLRDLSNHEEIWKS